MGKSQILKFACLTVAGAALAAAGTICPAGNGAVPFPHNPDGAATGCNVVITIAANGTVSTSVKDTTPYENSEDVLVGVVNNGTTPLSTLTVTGAAGSGLFGFDGDGICTFTFVGSTYCTPSQISGTDPADYQGPTSTFSNFATFDSGTVNFSPAVAANGGTTYFSLEGLPSASITGSTGGSPAGPAGTPAPPTLILTLTALAGMGLYFGSRHFMKARQ